MSKKPASHTWRVYLIRAKLQYIGEVDAADEKAAIKKIIEEHQIPANQQARLVAQRVP